MRNAAFVALGIVALLAVPAFAQPGDASRRAVSLGYEADGLYARGRWAEAYDRFAAADALAHSPVFVLYMARCRKNAARLIDARTLYERVAREPVPPNAPKPFRDAVADAGAELSEVRQRIPSVSIAVSGAQRSAVTVTIDGELVRPSTAPVELDPGRHDIAASAGARSAHATVELAEGAHAVPVALQLTAERPPAAATSPEPPSESGGSVAPALVALSLGVAGVAVGSVTGALAASKASDVKANCVDGHCLTSQAGELASAKRLATVSTIGFVAGGVALAAAGVLFVVRPGKKSARATPSITALASPVSIDVATAF